MTSNNVKRAGAIGFLTAAGVSTGILALMCLDSTTNSACPALLAPINGFLFGGISAFSFLGLRKLHEESARETKATQTFEQPAPPPFKPC